MDEFIVTGWFYSCLVSFKRCWLEVAFTLFFNVTPRGGGFRITALLFLRVCLSDLGYRLRYIVYWDLLT